jgi:nicotinamidase-related amidase
VVENVRHLAAAARARGVVVIHVWFIVEPGAPDRLARAVSDAIRKERGPLWGLERVPQTADWTLRAYHLVRAPRCVRVRSNLDNNSIQACPLLRTR